jgi:transcriptional regulator with XRE-family HTH domain
MKSRPTSSTLPYLKSWRMYRMLQGQELARRAGLANSTISGIERRKRTATRATIEKLAAVLRITPEQLLHEWPQGMDPLREGE